MADRGSMEREALLGSGADARQMRMEQPVEAGPSAEATSRPGEGLDHHVLSLLKFRNLHQIGAHRRRTDEEHVVFFGGVDVLQVEMGQGTRRERERHRLGRTEIARCGVERADDVLVDLAVQHPDRRHLHDAAAAALRGADVELGPLRLVVPLDQSGRNLGETVDARRDIPVQSTRDGGSAAGNRGPENGLVAFYYPFNRRDCAQPKLALLKKIFATSALYSMFSNGGPCGRAFS